MRILVTNTNTYRLLSPSPIGASLVAARLKRDGHDVRFLDCNVEKKPRQAVVEAARSFQPELLCFSIRNRDNMTPGDFYDPIPEIASMLQAVRQVCPAPMLLGGTAFTTYPKRVLDVMGAEWGYCGDDLEPIARFVRSLAAGCPDRETPGLVHRTLTGDVVENPFQIVGYRDVTFDNWDLVDLSRYRRGYWQAGVVTRTGCPENCAFCDTFHTFGKRFVLRDPAEVAGDLLKLKRTGKVKSVFLVDAGFNRPLEHAKDVLREILKQGAQLQLWSVFDPGQADDEFFALYKRAGGAAVVVFAESFSDPVLRAMGKSFTRKEIDRDMAGLHRAGVGTMLMPTLGGPGETRETALETLQGGWDAGSWWVDFSVGWRIQPRTPLYDRAVAEGVIGADDDGWEAKFYVSPDTPQDWLLQQIRRFKRRNLHRMAWRVLPMTWAMAVSRPWTHGPESATT